MTKASISKKKAVTLKDVAERAGVSRWLAGHVLNGGKSTAHASLESVEQIRKAAKDLNYHSNYAAGLLRGKRSHTFGLLVSSAGDPLRSFLVQYLDAKAVQIGCHTLISNTFSNPAVPQNWFEDYVEEFVRRGVDGVFCAIHPHYEEDRAALLERHPNTVFYEDQGVPDAACVSVDREAAARLAVRHLVERGRRRIGLAMMTLSLPAHLDRFRGYELELQAHGLPVDEQLVFNGEPHGLAAYPYCDMKANKWEFPIELMDMVIDTLVCDAQADAIVAYDDFWAASLIKRMRVRGIKVPQQVAVVGYLNHYLCDWTDPAITTIDLSHEAAAGAMVQMLEQMVTDGPLPKDQRKVKIKPKLIVREST
ncbi:MAG: LacI family transcriptional regulator [Phycisphaerae bacterium]|nr:LacI family transcriptional regulator [Phycisphaerae bacterium]